MKKITIYNRYTLLFKPLNLKSLIFKSLNLTLLRSYALTLFLLFFFLPNTLHAQSCPKPGNAIELDVNNIRAYFKTNGAHFFREKAEFEVPKGSGKTSLFAGALWLGAKDDEDKLYVAAMKYGQSGNDYWTGPSLSNNQANTCAYYDQFWKVTKKEIDDHIAGTLYIIPQSIRDWPAHGRASFGEPFLLAPYKNVSGANSYTPEYGDYPLIRGDEAIFWINNDVGGGFHGESGGAPLGVEIISMAYAYQSEEYALNHTMFLSYEIRNTSDRNYKDLYVGFFADFDIGYAKDDYIGCDSLLNLCYGYNGKPIDKGQTWAYGEYPPAQGAMFLNKKMNSFMYYNNGWSPTGDPSEPAEFYNYLQGLWKNGTPLTYGGTGYNPDSTNYTKFAFSGDPETKAGWSEMKPNGQDDPSNVPDDRRGVMSAGPFNLKAGEKITIDIALPFAQDLEGDYLTSVTMLKQNAQKIQEFYDNFILDIKQIEPKKGLLTVYPNPSNGQFIVSSNQNIKTIDFYDVMGRVQKGEGRMEKGEGKIYIDFSNLPKGFYMYRAVLEDNSVCSGKIIVQ